jgi:arylsulfatase A-like enzyme
MLTRRQLFAAAPALARAAAPRLNYILILADDLGYGDLACYGSATNPTPHLNRLAADGARFTDHYSCSPVCSPARAGLLTGLRPERAGVTGVLRDRDDATGLDLRLPTLADEFRKQGWRTALIGKWHLGVTEPYWPTRRGFDYFWGFLSGTIDYFTHESRGGGATGRRVTYENEKLVKLEGYYPELMTARAVRFIEENRAEPYFLYFSSPLPHTPLAAPERWTRPFRDRMDETRATYAGMVSCLDDAVGQMRAALERTGQWDRTVLVFLSDNGWVKKVTPQVAPAGSNAPFRGGKYELLEGGVRSPAIVRWPGLTRPGSVCREVSWFPDWLPTFTGRAAEDGVDLRGALAGRSLPARTLRWRFADAAVKTPPSLAARKGRWKFLQVGAEKRLFDLEKDPGESTDVLAAHRDIAAALEADLAR